MDMYLIFIFNFLIMRNFYILHFDIKIGISFGLQICQFKSTRIVESVIWWYH